MEEQEAQDVQHRAVKEKVGPEAQIDKGRQKLVGTDRGNAINPLGEEKGRLILGLV